MLKLSKNKTANDFRGCQFHYSVFTTDNEKTYVCEEFPEISADSLLNLKRKISLK